MEVGNIFTPNRANSVYFPFIEHQFRHKKYFLIFVVFDHASDKFQFTEEYLKCFPAQNWVNLARVHTCACVLWELLEYFVFAMKWQTFCSLSILPFPWLITADWSWPRIYALNQRELSVVELFPSQKLQLGKMNFKLLIGLILIFIATITHGFEWGGFSFFGNDTRRSVSPKPTSFLDR